MKRLEKDAETLATKVVALWRAEKIDEAVALCAEKIAELSETYQPSTVVKTCQPFYRQHIAIAAGIDVKGYRFSDMPMSLFAVDAKTVAEVNNDSRITVKNQRNNLIPITREIVDKLLEIAVELVTCDGNTGKIIYGKAVGLCILTGRRPYAETLHHARFEKCDDDNSSVVFYGQAKGGIEKREKGYTIPVLGCTSDVIIKAQSEVTEYIHSRPWYRLDMTDTEIAGQCKKQVQQVIDTKVDVIFNEIRNAGYKVPILHPHDLRKLYAFIVWIVRNRQTASFTQFAPEILGHYSMVKHLDVETPNTQSSESYDKYRLLEVL